MQCYIIPDEGDKDLCIEVGEDMGKAILKLKYANESSRGQRFTFCDNVLFSRFIPEDIEVGKKMLIITLEDREIPLIYVNIDDDYHQLENVKWYLDSKQRIFNESGWYLKADLDDHVVRIVGREDASKWLMVSTKTHRPKAT